MFFRIFHKLDRPKKNALLSISILSLIVGLVILFL